MIERVLTSHLVDFELLNADSIIVNCGAGDGDFARILHARTGATVHCYEPFPEENRLAPDYGLRIYPFAIGEMSGIKTMFFSPNHLQGSSLHARTVPINTLGQNSREVLVLSLDSVLGRWGQVDYVNLDIEGEEWWIMETRPAALGKIKQLCVQFHTDVGGSEWPQRLEKIIANMAQSFSSVVSPHNEHWCYLEVLFSRQHT